MRKPLPDCETLRDLYETKRYAIGDIAQIAERGHRHVRAGLHLCGIRQRAISEQKAIDLSRMSYEKRMAMTAASRSIITGRKRSDADLCKRARTKQERASLSGDEAEIMRALRAAGLEPIPLLAVDRYNIDFAFPDNMVAVEYHGGNWHNTPAKQGQDARKAAFLRSIGWKLLVFPRLDKPQANNAGNRRIALDEIINQTRKALH